MGQRPVAKPHELRRASCARPTWCDENGAFMRRVLAEGERLAVLFQNEIVAREFESTTPIQHSSVAVAQGLWHCIGDRSLLAVGVESDHPVPTLALRSEQCGVGSADESGEVVLRVGLDDTEAHGEARETGDDRGSLETTLRSLEDLACFVDATTGD